MSGQGKAILTPAGLRRSKRAIERIERSYVGPSPVPPARLSNLNPGWRWAVVGGSAIGGATAGTGEFPPTPAHGDATIYHFDASTNGWTVGAAVQAYNMAAGTGQAVPAGSLVGLMLAYKVWWIVWVYCP